MDSVQSTHDRVVRDIILASFKKQMHAAQQVTGNAPIPHNRGPQMQLEKRSQTPFGIWELAIESMGPPS